MKKQKNNSKKLTLKKLKVSKLTKLNTIVGGGWLGTGTSGPMKNLH